MQFLTGLLGGSENMVLNTALALGIVLVLIVIGLWLLKLLSKASVNVGRGPHRRLSIIDTVSVDTRRRLLIVRRDNVEHLIMTGGPQDLLVETNIAVTKPANTPRRPVAPVPANEPKAPETPVTETEPVNAARGRIPAERLRELGRAAGQRKMPSLRHTGLMRPVSRNDAAVIPMNPENSDQPRVDSAKTGPQQDTNGQAKLGAVRYIGDAFKTEGS